MSSIPYPYLILGVETSASVEDVERAYKQKVLKYHPDKFPSNMDDKKKSRYLEKFRAITQARDDILKELKEGPSSSQLSSMVARGNPDPYMNRRRSDPKTDWRRNPGNVLGFGLFDDLFDVRQLDTVFDAMEQRMQSMKIIDDNSTASPHGVFYSRTEVFKNDNGRKMRSVQENNNGTIRTYDEVDGRRVNRRQLR